MAEESTVVPGGEIDAHVADNYRALVEDPNRTLTYKTIAETAEEQNDPGLAAWARREAAGKNEDVTPVAANPKPDKLATRRIGKDTHVVEEDETPRVLPYGIPATGVPYDYDELSITELKDLATQRLIDQSDLKLKADYVAIHELWDEQDGSVPTVAEPIS